MIKKLINLDSFVFWLFRYTELHQNSIHRYANAVKIISRFPDVLKEFGDIFTISDLNTLKSIENVYFSDLENQRKNIVGNNLYSAAFHHYREYVEYLLDQTPGDADLDFISHDKIDFALSSGSYDEARKRYYLHIRNERKVSITNEAKRRFRSEHGHLFCEKCNYNRLNNESYGNEVIEAHYLLPEGNVMMLCPICHRKLHIYMSKNSPEEMTRDTVKTLF